MASLPEGFDAKQHRPLSAREPLPAGRYLAAIVSSEMKPTKRGDGEYLELRFQVLDGDAKGRHLVSRLNLRNPSARAEELARAELSAICRAVGVLTPGDSSDLHDIPLLIDVRVSRRADTGDLSNEIRGYARYGGGAAHAATVAPGEGRPWD